MTNEIKDWKTRPFIDKVNMVRLFETESCYDDDEDDDDYE